MKSRSKQIRFDWYECDMPKSPTLCECHSWEEFLFACLLESDPSIVSYETQAPPILYLKDSRSLTYRPDIYAKKTNGQNFIAEVKPEAVCSQDFPWISAVNQWAETHGASFRFITNESVDDNAFLALNWFRITRYIQAARDEPLEGLLETAEEALRQAKSLTVGAFTAMFSASPEHVQHAVPCHLLHFGIASAPLADEPYRHSLVLSAA